MYSQILVTGGAGFLGRAVARQLDSLGVEHIAIDRPGLGRDGVVECDVSDVHTLHTLALSHSFGAIVHCAGYSGPMLGLENPGGVVATNVGGTANLLELARIHSIQRFVFCSSVSAVGPTKEKTGEEVVTRPTSVYGATKAACESLASAYRFATGITTLSLRLGAIWGPERRTPCFLGSMIEDAVAHRETVLDANGDFPMQYIHVDDAAEAVLCALRAERPRRHIYNINGGSLVTLDEVAHAVGSVLPEARIRLGAGNELYDWQEEFQIDAARDDLGFRPRVSLADGIVRFAQQISREEASEQTGLDTRTQNRK